MLKNFCNTNSIFEKMCKELGLEYTFPPVHNRKSHRLLGDQKGSMHSGFLGGSKGEEAKGLKRCSSSNLETRPDKPRKLFQ